MRYYRLVDTITGKYIHKFSWDRLYLEPGKIVYRPKIVWETPYSHSYKPLPVINSLVESLIYYKMFSTFDTLELQAVDELQATVRGSLKLKHIRARYEQKELMRKLKL